MTTALIIAGVAAWWLGGAWFAAWAWTLDFDLGVDDAVVCILGGAALGPFMGCLWLLCHLSDRRDGPPIVLWRARRK